MDLRQKANLIKENVTMLDVLGACGIQTRGKQKDRIPCPIHSGRNKNFSYMESGFHCFKCDASGDVIAFVQQFKNIDFVAALNFLNSAFRLWSGDNGKSHEKPYKARKPQKPISECVELFKDLERHEMKRLNDIINKKGGN